jgi:hypothetical protein
VPRRPCLDCPSFAEPGKSRCAACASARSRSRDRARGNASQRGYGHSHRQRRAVAIAAEPWCHATRCPYADAGTPANPFSLEHLDPNDRNGPVTVLCHRCNSARRGRR